MNVYLSRVITQLIASVISSRGQSSDWNSLAEISFSLWNEGIPRFYSEGESSAIFMPNS
jgi:hypothetical protein